MKSLLETIGAQMTTGNTFLTAAQWEANYLADVVTTTPLIVLLPYSIRGKQLRTSKFENKYSIGIMFLYVADLDDDFDSRYTNNIEPAENQAFEYLQRCFQSRQFLSLSRSPDEIEYSIEPLFNVLDTNYDGVLLTVELPQLRDRLCGI